ncbi:circularly permuted type 2 ATP-grasp protein [Thauera sp.]|uniref:circularly permuted type 2 ATP-grasp protein n=1 Tax=Thauera sp. TaxID=1905334 RepID=UPI001B7135C3|nr:circularly permuted type 2 ATP-grasp protein [Thauera sp.]MBP6131029.1 circularly permuted type 2 ATP-grasp protein [Thauera sp.]MBP7048658.1 circularly permuted type 2 ATP-grasp protein [Thauera sp.]
MQVQPQHPPALLARYVARPDRYDELCQRIGSVVVLRPHWRDFFHGLAAMPADELSARRAALGRQIHENGITYNVYADPRGFARPWELDLLPYMLPAAEWAQIEVAVIQRATLFDRILADLYGEQTLLEQGLVPPALIYGHSGFLRPLVGARPAGGRFLHLYAVDLARSPDGRWWVVADRTQAPSGAGYALENRSVVARVLPELYRAAGVEPLVPFFEGFRDGLVELAPADGAAAGEDPLIVVLTPGPYNETYFEHAFLAREMGFPLVEGQDLTVRDDKVWLRTLEGLRRVHVILRRVDDLWCDPLELREDSALGVAGLVAAVRAGMVTVANALGSGILETGALLGYLPRLCEHLLGSKLRMPSVATWWCGEPAACEYALKHLRELVIKPAYPTLGARPVFCGDLPAAELDALAARIALRPFDFVAQEMVNLSQAPVLADEAGGAGNKAPARDARALVARNIGLRVFAAAGAEGFRVLPGGLVRVASEADMRIVSMQHGGGSKDAWVLGSPARPRPVPRIVPGQLAPFAGGARVLGLSSRVAENFFWLGRYSERADAAARLGRETLARLGEAGEASWLGEDGKVTAALQALCRQRGLLATVAGEADAAPTPPAPLAQALFDPAQPGSVVANLRQVLRVAALVRDRLSPDSWRIYNRLSEFAAAPAQAPRLGEALQRLDESLLSLVTLSGFVIESMPRDAGWRFLSIGRRIERLQFLAAALSALLLEPSQGGLKVLLAITDAELRYRSRHARGLAPQPVAELVMLDGDNPRALRYQLDSLAEHVALLPDGAALAAPLRERLAALDALALCDCFVHELAGACSRAAAQARHCEPLRQVLDDIWRGGNALADALARRYFTHLDARSRATVSL